MSNVRFQIGEIDSLELVYCDYEKTFPSNERKSYERMKNMINDGLYKFILMTNNNDFLGYAFFYTLKHPKVIWLDYIAVKESARGMGLGGLFFNYLVNDLGREFLGILLEVEIPSGDPNQIRRINFYERLGAMILPFVYAMPSNSGPLPMHLMYKKINPKFEWSQNVSSDAVASVHKYIHQDIL